MRRKAAVDEERGIVGKEKRAEGFLSGTLEDGGGYGFGNMVIALL